MPRKEMRCLLFSSKVSTSPSPSPSPTPSPSVSHFPLPSRFGLPPSRPSFSESVMNRTLEMAEPIIMKWNPETTTFAKVTSLFYGNRNEAIDFIQWVKNLQNAMQLFITGNSSSEKIVRAQNLMQIAMKRLQKEFYQILSMNRAHLDPESVSTRSSRTSIQSSISVYDEEDDDDIKIVNESMTEVEDGSSIAMADLKLIADFMISCGYAKECLKIYTVIRKSIVDEGIFKLGVEKFSASQIHKMDWNALESRINNWLNAVITAVKTLFNGEKILCDHVFASSDSIRESCFNEITKEGAMILFGFPENVAKNSKKSSDKVYRILEMYTGISDRWPEIDSIFSFSSTAIIKSQALTSLVRLGEYVRTALYVFESDIVKDTSKSLVAGAGIHNLTIDVMNYLSVLSDYSNILSDILADSPPPANNSALESYLGFTDSVESPAPPVTRHMAQLILVLLCKLDVKAKYYKDVSLSYLFLANNLQYVVVKVRTSNMKYLLGDDWLSKHDSMVQQFAASYERLGWSLVTSSLPEDPTALHTREQVKEIFKKFNSLFDQVYRKQSVCVVLDKKLRDDIKVRLARKIFRGYRAFYNAHGVSMQRERNSTSVVRFAPEDVGHRLSDLFFASNNTM
ncbi:exocyst complex component EXO70H1-like [Olea europaea var. sylvestris]|uniref:exocyst complex component EXO70H1-like n=1 Tax=Olea europaea var. sylvestris TaxID=158386 RepID=UPI000C1D151B|nr:exocyst complex component EXO70H1-like [Olea europaea var. sylvestris]